MFRIRGEFRNFLARRDRRAGDIMQLRKELGNFNTFEAKPQVRLQLPTSWTSPDEDTKAQLIELETSHGRLPSEARETNMEAYMRAVLIDWLLEITSSLAYSRQTLHLAIAYADTYVATRPVAQAKFQLLGCACLFIAAKFEEVYTPRLSTIKKSAADTFTEPQILEMEQSVLLALDWHMLPPTLYAWTRYLMRCWDDYIQSVAPVIFVPFQSEDPESFQLYIDAMSWLDLSLMDPTHAKFPRPHLAAGVVLQVVSNSTLNQVSLLEVYRCFEVFVKAVLSIRSFRRILQVVSLLSEFSDPKVKATVPTPRRSKRPLQFEEIFSQQHYSSSLLSKYKAKHKRFAL